MVKLVSRIDPRASARAGLLVTVCAVLPLISCGEAGSLQSPVLRSPAPPVAGVRVVNVFPHDRAAFTQGLIFHEGFLFESTGLHGRSTLRKVRLETGEVIRRHNLTPQHFGEGLAYWKSQLVQLTWQSNLGLVYDGDSFDLLRTFTYRGEGWGLTSHDRGLIMSDGTSRLRFLNPETFVETGGVDVMDGSLQVSLLNELEMVRGELYANVWQTDTIARIDPASGRVTGWIDLTSLLSPAERESADVLNGIAWDSATDRLFVTGKLWPKLFEIALVPRSADGDASLIRTAARRLARRVEDGL
jgi:glutamine cyclotransferase